MNTQIGGSGPSKKSNAAAAEDELIGCQIQEQKTSAKEYDATQSRPTVYFLLPMMHAPTVSLHCLSAVAVVLL